MAKYQFPEFPNLTFIDPTVTPNKEDIRVHVSTISISVSVTLTGSGYEPSVVLIENVVVQNLNWEDDANLMMRVNEGLVQYEV
jgi:hypothetical protein